jgi:hypothetical protein
MPLIECPACGRQISVEAEACPQCGHPNRRPLRGLLTIIATVIHAVLALVLFLGLLFWIPRHEKIFKDYNMQLPLTTVMLMAISNLVRRLWYVVIFPVGLLFAGDVWILSLLRRTGRWLWSWLWFIGVALLLLVAIATVMIAIWLPYIKLNEGLSK